MTVIAFGHSAGDRALDDGRVQLPAGLPAAAALISENVLRRALGLLEPPPEVERSLGRAEVERLSGLTPNLVSCLVLFDVLEPVDERFAYRDLVAAREAARLLKRGVALGDVLDASIALGRRGGHLAEARLTEGPSGTLVREIAGQLAELSGQLTMPPADAPGAEGAQPRRSPGRGGGGGANAAITPRRRASTPRRCAPTPADPVLPFNLGNVFQAQGRATEAKVAWQIAVARDPAFAEAWYNLALAAEDEQQTDLAVAQYRRAVQAQPDYADAHFNLALLLTRLDRCSRGARRLGAFPRARTVVQAGGHGAEGDRALPHEDPAGAGAGGLSVISG